jgi:hypothetical protein
LCRFFVGKSGGADQDEGFALLSRQLFQRPAKVFHFQVIDLIWQQCQCFRTGPINILYLAAALAVLRAEQIAQNGEKPRRHIGAGLEGIEVRPCPQQCLLDQIVGSIDVAAERHGECA